MKPYSNFEKYIDDRRFITFLEAMMPESKLLKIDQVIPYRTKHITVVAENVLNSNNANAIIRTCEAIGLQEVSLVYGDVKFIPQKSVSKGAHKWIDLLYYDSTFENNTQNCIHKLKENGFQIVVTSPNATDSIHDIDLKSPVALCFGQESKGISASFSSEADKAIALPQFGFTQSYNVAVAAGMILLPLAEKLRQSELPWQLSSQEQDALRRTWILNHFPNLKYLYQIYLQNHF